MTYYKIQSHPSGGYMIYTAADIPYNDHQWQPIVATWTLWGARWKVRRLRAKKPIKEIIPTPPTPPQWRC